MAQSEGACCWAHNLSLDPRAERGFWLPHMVSDLHAHALTTTGLKFLKHIFMCDYVSRTDFEIS